VNSRRSRGQRNVQPVIDEDTRGSRPRSGSGETREFHERSRLEIFLTNLNPIGAGSGRAPDAILQRALARQSGISWRRMECS